MIPTPTAKIANPKMSSDRFIRKPSYIIQESKWAIQKLGIVQETKSSCVCFFYVDGDDLFGFSMDITYNLNGKKEVITDLFNRLGILKEGEEKNGAQTEKGVSQAPSQRTRHLDDIHAHLFGFSRQHSGDVGLESPACLQSSQY